jgi:hypothetical protein
MTRVRSDALEHAWLGPCMLAAHAELRKGFSRIPRQALHTSIDSSTTTRCSRIGSYTSGRHLYRCRSRCPLTCSCTSTLLITRGSSFSSARARG